MPKSGEQSVPLKGLIHTIQLEAQQRQRTASLQPCSLADRFTLLSDARALLNNAEFRARARMIWPKKLNRFPLNVSSRLQRIILKSVALLFRDQQEVNLSLVNSLRQSLQLQQQLMTELSDLKKECRAQQAQIATLQAAMVGLGAQE